MSAANPVGRNSRAKDEIVLRALRLRAVHGLPMEDIATRLGVTKNAVVGMVFRARADDLQFSREPESVVRLAYEPQTCTVDEQEAIFP